MSRLLIVSFKDQDIADGLKKLLSASSLGIDEIVYPSVGDALAASVESIADHFDLVTHKIDGAGDAALADIKQEDTLAFVWDDTSQIHKAFLSVEDYGCSSWDVSDGLASIETAPEEDDLEAELVSAFLGLMEVMSDYITENVLAMVEHTLYHIEHDED